MLGEFEVHEAVALEDRSLFALVGAIREGTPRAGMQAALEGSGETFDEPVHGVEFVEEEGEEGASPALTFSYSRDEELDEWRAIDWPGRRLALRFEREA